MFWRYGLLDAGGWFGGGGRGVYVRGDAFRDHDLVLGRSFAGAMHKSKHSRIVVRFEHDTLNE